MIDPLIAFVLVGATVAVAYGVATFPRKVREFFAATAPKPAAEAELIAMAQAEVEHLLYGYHEHEGCIHGG